MQLYFSKNDEQSLANLLSKKYEYNNERDSGSIYLKLCYGSYDFNDLSDKIEKLGDKKNAINNVWRILGYLEGRYVKTFSAVYVFRDFFEKTTNYSFYSKTMTLDGINKSPNDNFFKVVDSLRQILMNLDESGYGLWKNFKDLHNPGFITKGMVDYIDSRVKYWDKNVLASVPKSLFKKYGIAVEGSIFKILPLRKSMLPDKLVHYGILEEDSSSFKFSNSHNLKTKGVFGSEFFEVPIYFMNPEFDTSIIGCAASSSMVPNRVKVTVDSNKLLKFRSVFIDPESLHSYHFDKEFNNTFIALGGIPNDAIISIENL